MKTPKELEPLVPTLQALGALIDHFDKKGMVIGGAAVCLLGQPRMTADVDALLLVSQEDLPELLQKAGQMGFTPRIKDIEAFARKNRIILLRYGESDTDVDISLGALPLEIEAVQRSRVIRAGNARIRVPTVEDLIILKAVAHRPKDLVDIRALIEMHPNLDRGRIKHWVKEFADLIEIPEIWTDIANWIKQ